MFGPDSSLPLDSIAHIIQVALTPIFLLSGIAALLNVFSTRLGRVSDQVDKLTEQMATATTEETARLTKRLDYLRRRSWVLDAAVTLGALGGMTTCGAALALFVGALRDRSTAGILFTLFGTALTCTIGALLTFVAEVFMASRGLRAEVENHRAQVKASP
jgi:hypothetical protein